tara:strand:+ start:1278 stop:2258 length:981 start_codon:yes stop_codon:yes gene_type:complete
MSNSLINIKINKNIEIFLNNNQLSNNILGCIPQDASSRRYYRLNNNLLLMESTAIENRNYEFIKVSKYLKNNGLSAPEIIKIDHKKGLYLIEDFGDLTFNKALKKGISEKLLYSNAIKCLSYIHKIKHSIDLPRYDQNYLLKEVNLFTEWYFKEINITLNDESKKAWGESWIKIFKELKNNKLVLRDFHADNLFWLPTRANVKKIGIIDFQDALIGDEAYDISSLLEDVRRNVSKQTKEVVIQEFIKLNKIKNVNQFIKNYNILTAQRNAKIVGIFIRLARRDKKIKYLKFVNQAMKIFLTSARKGGLEEINNWIEMYIPKDKIYL